MTTRGRMPSAVTAGGGGDPLSAGGGTEPMLDGPDEQAEAADDRLLTTLADVSAMVGQTSASRVMVVVVSTGAIGSDRSVQASRTGRFAARSADPAAPRGGQVLLADLPPGRYQCRVAVHDRQNGRVGSVFLDVEVPSPGSPQP